MGNKLTLGENGNFAPSIGGQIMIAHKPDDTLNPIRLACGRNSARTQINKDGFIETIPPYQPAFNYVDGRWVGSNEPTVVQLAFFANSLTNWSTDGASVPTVSSEKLFGLDTFDLAFSSTNQAIYTTATVSSGEQSWYTYVKGVVGETVNIGLLPTGLAIAHTFNGEWERVEISGSSGSAAQFQFNTYSDRTARSFKVCLVQVAQALDSGSFIPSLGTTATRLADTGFVTPDLSEHINSEEGTIILDIAALSDDLTNRWLSLSSLNSNINQITFRFTTSSNLIQVVNVSNGVQDVVMQYTMTDITSYNKIAIRYKPGAWALAAEGGIQDTNTSVNQFTEVLAVFSMDRGNNSNYMFADLAGLIIEPIAYTDSELIDAIS